MDNDRIEIAWRATWAAARATVETVGRGDSQASDKAAVDAMRAVLASSPARWRVVIGEGERDQAPMLYMGEELGAGAGDITELALDPLEGTGLAARAEPGALSVVALAPEGCLLRAPDVYMEKIAVGPKVPAEALTIGMTPAEAVGVVAENLALPIAEVTVAVLERDRHKELIANLRATGCRVQLFGDGDVAVALGLALPHPSVHLYMGIGGAPEGVLSAAGLSCLGGSLCGKLVFRNEAERARAKVAEIKDLDRVYRPEELASGDLAFIATGITSGSLLQGFCVAPEGGYGESLVLTADGTCRKSRIFVPNS